MEIRLTPSGTLKLMPPDDTTNAGALPHPLEKAFRSDWREGLFLLAAKKTPTENSPTLGYWQGVSERYLSALCTIAEQADAFDIPSPDPADCEAIAQAAPPMRGGEYLNGEMLLSIWKALDNWVHDAVAASKNLTDFITNRAPKWHQVGRVCFHLAENKNDEQRPFAFMATFTMGFGASGQLKHLPLQKALQHYAGARNRPALIKLLSPVHQAAEAVAWVKELVDSGGIYKAMAWPAKKAYRFLKTVPQLAESGLSVRLPNWWKKKPRPVVAVTIGNRKSAIGIRSMLDFNVRVALGKETLSPEELAGILNGTENLVLLKGQWVEVDREKLSEALDHWQAISKSAQKGEISFIEGMRLLSGAPADLKQEDWMASHRPWVHVAAGEAMRRILSGLRNPETLSAVGKLEGLEATLRGYQREGVAWLHFLVNLGLGACLADDMGLGKTLQVLALLVCERKRKRTAHEPPSLLVVPASLLGNWKNEARRFAPSLNMVFLHPSETDRTVLARMMAAPDRYLGQADLVVTTYAMATRQQWLAGRPWRWVILDEAQAIKNPGARQTRTVKQFKADARIALTGTPIENRLGDLWSLFDFLNPGLLGSAAVFKSFVKTLQERAENPFAPLRQLVGPYILRRLKTDRRIVGDLPDKTETQRFCQLTKAQVKCYEQVVRSLKNALETLDGMARRGLVLQSLMRLKQICNHPSQFTGDGDFSPEQSGKFQRIAEICEEIADRQEKVLVFTQFREIIDPLAHHLGGIFKESGLVLHGGTRVQKRKEIVARFQEEDGPPFFILSLKAGGTGLNLTAATHVIHFDRWWNPAVENQATDRAFRIGQKRNVLVHKFVTQGTVEERIDTMISEKRQLAREVLSGEGEVNLTELSDDALLELVRLDVTRAMV